MPSNKRIDSASRYVRASVEEVFAAFADPVAWQQWLPPQGMTASVQQFEFREGGTFRLTLTYVDTYLAGKTTANEDVSEGTFSEIVPNERVVQRIVFESDDPAFAGEMLMAWSLEPIEAGTRVNVRAEDVPVGISPEDHEVGLNSTLDNLARYVEDDQ